MGIFWDRATRVDARDVARWMQIADKPVRMHWRHQRAGLIAKTVPQQKRRLPPGTPNPVTGKSTPGTKYAPNTRAHCETVLRTFYDFHRDEGTGPLINPFPLTRSGRAGRAHAHHSPAAPFHNEGQGSPRR